MPGANPTYPTFVCGAVVVKFFGGLPGWRAAAHAERVAHRVLAQDPEILAPRVLAEGELDPGGPDPWPYLVTARARGTPLAQLDPSPTRFRRLAASLGAQLARVHALAAPDLPTPAEVDAPTPLEGARRSRLAPHLAEQVDGYIARLPPAVPVLVHGDLVSNHVYVEGDEVTALIDWGDALRADRHYDLAKLMVAALRCRHDLLDAFLEGAAWTRDPQLPRRALGWALVRQATGLGQHRGFDVFYELPGLPPWDQLRDLDQLATALFGPAPR